MDIEFSLHPGQIEVFQSPKRFTITVAGRRWGKSRLSCIKLLIEAMQLKNKYGYDVSDKDVFYIAPTFQQAKDIMWRQIKTLGQDVIKDTLENTGVIRMKNGRQIHLKGSDKPDSLRGVGLSFVVLDEYATMKPETWDQIIRPTLTDVKGGAMFIGTPAGKNHFYQLYLDALNNEDEWDVFEFYSNQNPFLDAKEIEVARNNMSTAAYKQEFEASFTTGGSETFKEEWIQYGDEIDGDWYISVDPAGYADAPTLSKSKLKKLDETAIACVKVGPQGWYVDDIVTGRWDIRETSLKVLLAARKYRPVAIGIEKGSLKNAITPYLHDQMRRLHVYPHIVETTHGGKKKTERIIWALQGRMEHGRIFFREGNYLNKFRDQLMDFPNPMAHDDLLDALAYIDQLATVGYGISESQLEWEPLDEVSGY